MHLLQTKHLHTKPIRHHLIPQLKPNPKLPQHTSTQYPSQHKLGKHGPSHPLPKLIILRVEDYGQGCDVEEGHQADYHHADAVDVYYHGVGAGVAGEQARQVDAEAPHAEHCYAVGEEQVWVGYV